MTLPARITTFYSYKGGTGRSMAVANLAVLMARTGRSVLAMDFDLDAPGLHRYFPKPPDEPARHGVIDFFVRLRSSLEEAFPEAVGFRSEDSGVLDRCREIVRRLLDDEGFFQPTSEGSLQLMTAGRFDAAYADTVRGFPWADFFSEFGEVFAILREELKTRYAEVLIDSRTGLTDLGSVSTVIMPDRLVVVFTPNEQSSAGAAEIAQQSFHLHATLSKNHGIGPLEIIPLMSRVDRGELVERKQWVANATATFSKMFRTLQREGPNFVDYFNERHIPYSGYYSYGERIAVAEDKDVGYGSLVEAYQHFAAILDSPAGFQHWRFGGERSSAPSSAPAPPSPPPQMHPGRRKLELAVEKVRAQFNASNMPYQAEVALSDGVWERSSQGLAKWQGTSAYLVPTFDDDDAFGLAVRGGFSPYGRVVRVPNSYIRDAWLALLPTGAPGIGLRLDARLVTQGNNNDELVFEDTR